MKSTVRYAALIVLLVLSIACDSSSLGSPTPEREPGPATPSPLPSSGTFKVSGLVREYTATGARSAASIPVQLFHIQSGQRFDTTSDAAGGYSFAGIPAGAVVIGPPASSAFRAPCPSGTSVLNTDSHFPVHVAAVSLLSTSGTPASLPRTAIYFSGQVVETVGSLRQPLAGAHVELILDEHDLRVLASTLTDSVGRYLICSAPPNVGTDQLMWLRVLRAGYEPTLHRVFGGGDYFGADIELVRQ